MAIPKDAGWDKTAALFSEGYRFISNRCEKLGSDLFETRLMLRKAVCLRGEEAARIFFDPERFTRQGAIPPSTVMLLQGRGSVQMKDGAAHVSRKSLFMSVLREDGVRRLTEAFVEAWMAKIPQWKKAGSFILHREFEEILCRAVCRWAGLSLSEDEIKRRTREFSSMVEGAGGLGPATWQALFLRKRCERWAREMIREVREGNRPTFEGSALRAAALHREPDGELLGEKIAAIELINFLRPTVAVARFMTFSALALHEHPENRERLAKGSDEERELFVQEVRRFYPFFPFVGGRAKLDFEWSGHFFRKRDWVLFDIYGTNHHPALWEDPHLFRPDRFRAWNGSAYNFVPQGGGSVHRGHRCPGERPTIELTKTAVQLLTSTVRYEVPAQDLSISLRRIPALPKSGFVVSGLREKTAPGLGPSSFLDAGL